MSFEDQGRDRAGDKINKIRPEYVEAGTGPSNILRDVKTGQAHCYYYSLERSPCWRCHELKATVEMTSCVTPQRPIPKRHGWLRHATSRLRLDGLLADEGRPHFEEWKMSRA